MGLLFRSHEAEAEGGTGGLHPAARCLLLLLPLLLVAAVCFVLLRACLCPRSRARALERAPPPNPPPTPPHPPTPTPPLPLAIVYDWERNMLEAIFNVPPNWWVGRRAGGWVGSGLSGLQPPQAPLTPNRASPPHLLAPPSPPSPCQVPRARPQRQHGHPCC